MKKKHSGAAVLQFPNIIKIRGARTHNLANIDLDIPKNSLTVVIGLSGSGKSSLAFDTLYAEGQGRYIDSLSTYSRQFLQRVDKPDVDLIEGLSPAIAIEQKTGNHNPRSTVGTVTEIQDYLRLLFARAGTPFCPRHHIALYIHTTAEIVARVLEQPADNKLLILAPLKVTESLEQTIAKLRAQGFVRFRINEKIYETIPADLDAVPISRLEVVVDRLKNRRQQQTRLSDSIETALQLGSGKVAVVDIDSNTTLNFSNIFACARCDYSIGRLEPQLFSFNSPAGACQECGGLGVVDYFDPQKIITFPSLSLANGAIPGWDRRNSFFYNLLVSCARHYNFDIDTPFEELSAATQQAILYGKANTVLTYKAAPNLPEVEFHGIVNHFADRYRTTDSPVIKEKLTQFVTRQSCKSCDGSRLNIVAKNVMLVNNSDNSKATIADLGQLSLQELDDYFSRLTLDANRQQVASRVLNGIKHRLHFLLNVGLSYLNLGRAANTLSGGEMQRIRLASQIGAGLSGVLYVLDEPSIGLHQRDNDRLIATLKNLRDLGNTVIVVEHDEDTIRQADYIVDMGPGAGTKGGRVVAAGDLDTVLAQPQSLTAQYLSGKKTIGLAQRRPLQKRQVANWLTVTGASGNNLADVTLKLPIGYFTCVTGVSGSGKSTLINKTLYPLAARQLNRSKITALPYRSISGLEHFSKVISVDQAPIGRTPRSNPATYCGILNHIRELLAATDSAKERGYNSGRFSFNLPGGRCPACQGDGLIKIEMHFLPDVYVTCDRCNGQRYNQETLEISYKGKNIAQILNFTISEAYEFFKNIPPLEKKLHTLLAVGLDYLKLGQSATTLSGGEAQRIKLALELARKDNGNSLYILDEPTTGLHFHDIQLLLNVLAQLRELGNTIVVIEHNLDVIRAADWIVDLGPEGGAGGGQIIAQGNVKEICRTTASITGRYLAQKLNTK